MKYYIGIGFSVVLFALFLFTVDIRRMLDALSGANYWFVLPAVVMYMVSVYFRSLRWTVMLRHLKPVKTMRLYPVITIGYMANNLLPMRLGELVRSYYVGEREGIDKTAALMTVLVERVFDALTLLFFIAVATPFVPVAGFVEWFAERLGVPGLVVILGFSLPFVIAFSLLVLFAAYPGPTHAFALKMASPLPTRLASVVDSLIAMLLQGLSPLREPRKLAILFVLSIPIWLTEAAVFWIMGFPFGLVDTHSGPGTMAVTMVLVTSITNIGSSVPLAPAGLGLFEFIARETLILSPLATVERPVAAGFAILVHAVIVLPMIVLGQVFLWAAHISLNRLTRDGRLQDRENRSKQSDSAAVTPCE